MKMSKKTILLTTLTATIAMSLTVASVAFAANATQASVTSGAKLTIQQASDIATNVNSGSTVDEIKLKNEKETAVYEVDMTNSNSTKSEVTVNATDGTIVENKAKTDKQTKNTQKTALKSQQQTLDNNWASMTAAQKEQVYVLKDAEFDNQIAKIKTHVGSGYKTQAEVDAIVVQIQAQKATMRTSGNAPKFDSIVNLTNALSK